MQHPRRTRAQGRICNSTNHRITMTLSFCRDSVSQHCTVHSSPLFPSLPHSLAASHPPFSVQTARLAPRRSIATEQLSSSAVRTSEADWPILAAHAIVPLLLALLVQRRHLLLLSFLAACFFGNSVSLSMGLSASIRPCRSKCGNGPVGALTVGPREYATGRKRSQIWQ